jgi:MFS family permease
VECGAPPFCTVHRMGGAARGEAYDVPAGAQLCDRLCFPKAPGIWAARHGDSDLAASLLRTSDAGDADARALQDISMKKRLSFVYIFSMVCLGLCYGAQGPATLALAEQCDIVKAANASSGKPIDASKLSQMGIATGMDALAGIFGTLIGGWCVDRVRRWHWVLCIYLIWQGLAFMSWTVVRSFPQLLVASLLWGFASTLPSFSTQAAMTWVWGKDVAPYMQLNNAGFGLGSLVAPLLVSAELRDRNSFHYGEQQGLSVSVSPLSLLCLSFFRPRLYRLCTAAEHD